MLSRVSSFSGPFSRLFKYNNSLETNLILDLQSSIGLSGVSWTDQSGYSNDATLYGTIATASIMNGTTVLSLDGINDYILPTGGFGNQLDTGFTYEVWASPGTSSNGTLLAEWSGVPTTGWNDSQMGFVSNKINVGVYSSVLSSYITGPTFSVNNWYNIVMTYNHLTDIVSLYINGYLFSTVSTVKSNPPANYLSLGRTDTANTYLGGLSGYFKGYIGSWRIWNGPISDTDILSNYNTNRANYAVSCWIYIHPVPDNTNEAYIENTSLVNFGGVPNILFNSQNATLSFAVDVNDVGGAKKIFIFPNKHNMREVKVIYSRWNHVFVNFTDGNMDIFVNGDLVTSTPEVIPLNNPKSIHIGSYPGIYGEACSLVYYKNPLLAENIRIIYESLKIFNPPTSN